MQRDVEKKILEERLEASFIFVSGACKCRSVDDLLYLRPASPLSMNTGKTGNTKDEVLGPIVRKRGFPPMFGVKKRRRGRRLAMKHAMPFMLRPGPLLFPSFYGKFY